MTNLNGGIKINKLMLYMDFLNNQVNLQYKKIFFYI